MGQALLGALGRKGQVGFGKENAKSGFRKEKAKWGLRKKAQ